MESVHFRSLHNSLLNSLISVIKEKLGVFKIETDNQDKPLLIESYVDTDIKKTVRVIQMDSGCLTLSDETSLKWEKIQNFQDLLKCLDFIEYQEKKRNNEFIFIKWGIVDFESRASELEENLSDTELKFNRTKFPYALRILEERHDCNFGITWNDVDDVLYEFCK